MNMKPIVIISICAALSITACTGKNEKKDQKTTDSTALINTEVLPQNFYKRLEGNINGTPIVLNLQKADDRYLGSYFKNGIPFNLRSDSLIGNDSVRLSQYSLATINHYDESDPFLFIKWSKNGFNASYLEQLKSGKANTSFLTEKYPEGSYRFDLAVYKDSIKANPKGVNSPIATIEYNYAKVNLNTDNGKWLNGQIKNILSLKQADENWDAQIKKTASQYLSDYQKVVGKETGASFNYSSATSISIEFNQQGFVVLNSSVSDYSGGAHGNYGSELFCFDVINKKKLKLDDVVKIDSNALQQLVEKNFRKQFNIKPSEGLNTILFENHLKANTNFYFNDQGILFLYNPYEIASYAQGQIVVFVPFTELKGFVNTDFAKRINIK